MVVPSRRPRIEGRHASPNGTTWKAKTNKFAAGIFQRKELRTGGGLNVKKHFRKHTFHDSDENPHENERCKSKS